MIFNDILTIQLHEMIIRIKNTRTDFTAKTCDNLSESYIPDDGLCVVETCCLIHEKTRNKRCFSQEPRGCDKPSAAGC
jgi:hypothetical protein